MLSCGIRALPDLSTWGVRQLHAPAHRVCHSDHMADGIVLKQGLRSTGSRDGNEIPGSVVVPELGEPKHVRSANLLRGQDEPIRGARDERSHAIRPALFPHSAAGIVEEVPGGAGSAVSGKDVRLPAILFCCVSGYPRGPPVPSGFRAEDAAIGVPLVVTPEALSLIACWQTSGTKASRVQEPTVVPLLNQEARGVVAPL